MMKKSLCLALVLLGLSNIPVECVQHSYIAQHQWTMRQWAGLALIAGGFPFALKSARYLSGNPYPTGLLVMSFDPRQDNIVQGIDNARQSQARNNEAYAANQNKLIAAALAQTLGLTLFLAKKDNLGSLGLGFALTGVLGSVCSGEMLRRSRQRKGEWTYAFGGSVSLLLNGLGLLGIKALQSLRQ